MDNPSIAHQPTGNRRDRTKNRPTPKRGTQRAARHLTYPRPESYRPYTRTDMIMTGAGWKQVTSRRVLNDSALKDAIDVLDFSNRAERAELCWIADSKRTPDELAAHCDVFAARFPDDHRWDAWRRYRRTQIAVLS